MNELCENINKNTDIGTKITIKDDHLCDEVAIVTGGGSGIGLAVAKTLASQGITVVVFDNNLTAAQKVVDEIILLGGKAYAKHVDVSREQSVLIAVNWVDEKVGIPSMLCNSAAIQCFGRTESFSFEQWQQVININLNGTFLMCKSVLSLLDRKNKTGRLVNIASLAGIIGLPYCAAYSSSKGGVITLTKSLAKEYADRDICINVVTPGAVDTPMLAMNIPKDINPKVLGSVPRSAKAPTSPEQIAKLIVFLLTEAPFSMTGSTVPIDGGSG